MTFKPERIKFPIIVQQIEFDDIPPIANGWRDQDVGKFVAIRPVKSICPNEKTYLGLLIGEVPISPNTRYTPTTGCLTFSRGHGNPAIFVFDLNRVVLGCESWWGLIKSENDLREITDTDINDTWYVKALRNLPPPEADQI